MMTCLVCERPTPERQCVVFELTAEEESVLVKGGIASPGPLVYCRGCWSILNDPQAAPQLMKGAAERLMLRVGVPPARAKASAEKLYTRLIELQRSRRHRTQA